jgi:D-serine deaminase-like pyridoxal phosphate-dependent protein
MIDAIDKAEKISFKGFLGHAGHSYNSKGYEAIQQVHTESLNLMQHLFDDYKPRIPTLEISVGDTPTCCTCEGFGCATEIRPGNYVFYDLTQAAIGSNAKNEIAVALACPVVAKHKDRNEIIFYGGGVHFSKDYLDLGNGKRSYGEWVILQESGWSDPVEGCFVSKLSQEHGTLKVTDEMFGTIETGDILIILPIHSCMTANLMGGYTTLDGRQLDYMDYRKVYTNF